MRVSLCVFKPQLNSGDARVGRLYILFNQRLNDLLLVDAHIGRLYILFNQRLNDLLLVDSRVERLYIRVSLLI